MTSIRRIKALIKLLFRRDAVEAEIDAEVRSFYDAMADRYREQGFPEQEAHRLELAAK